MLKAVRAGADGRALPEGPPQRSARGPAGMRGGFWLLQEHGALHPVQISPPPSTKATPSGARRGASPALSAAASRRGHGRRGTWGYPGGRWVAGAVHCAEELQRGYKEPHTTFCVSFLSRAARAFLLLCRG